VTTSICKVSFILSMLYLSWLEIIFPKSNIKHTIKSRNIKAVPYLMFFCEFYHKIKWTFCWNIKLILNTRYKYHGDVFHYDKFNISHSSETSSLPLEITLNHKVCLNINCLQFIYIWYLILGLYSNRTSI
jgi:hypothetical protein